MSRRVLWVGDSPRVTTGFARCTRAACDELRLRGWDVDILGINDFGDPDPEYHSRIWPCRQPRDGGRDAFGVTRLPRLIERLAPDVVVLLNDPWNIPVYLEQRDEHCAALERRGGAEAESAAERIRSTPVVTWLAVDGRNQDGAPLNKLDRVVVWTEFARDELALGGYTGQTDLVPLAVEHETFHPVDRAAARQLRLPVGVDRDAFIVGAVGRNQPRKRLDLTIEYFAQWIKDAGVDDAYLYLHVAPTGDRGVDIIRLARWHGLQKRLIIANLTATVGVEDADMAQVYAMFDVYLSTTQGEGWGLPALEAMACGVPVVVPDWSAFGCWARGAATLVPCTSTAPTAPINGQAYTIGGVPDRAATIEALGYFYEPSAREERRETWSRRGLERAAAYTWEKSGAMFADVLDDVVGCHNVAEEEVA